MYIFVDKEKFNSLNGTEQKEILSGSGTVEGRLRDSVLTISHVDYINFDEDVLIKIKGKTYTIDPSGLIYMKQVGTDSNFTMPVTVMYLEEL